MKSLNFLLAVKKKNSDERALRTLKDKMVAEINAQGKFLVGRFDFVFDRNKLNEHIASGTYDVVLCKEILGTENIGVGSIRSWAEEMPQVKIILLVGNERKGNIKLIHLIQRVKYTNALYDEDLNGENVVRLVEEGRSLEEAVIYYGIENSEEIKQMGIVKGTDKDSDIQEVQKEEPKREERASVIEEFVPEELEDAIEAFSDFDEFYEDEGEKEEAKELEEFFAEKEMAFDFGKQENVEKPGTEENVSFDFLNTAPENKVETPAEENMVKEAETAASQETPWNVSWQQASEEEDENEIKMETVPSWEVSVAGGLMVGTVKEEIVAARGYITKVVDYDSVLLEFDNGKEIAGLDMQAYRLMVRIKSGRRGGFENGRYRSANVSLEAYVEYMAGRQTAMLAVMDFDCDLNREVLENKKCDVILTKL